jgi:hypothetical protein
VITGATCRERSTLRGIRINGGATAEEEGSEAATMGCRINDGKNSMSDQYTADITIAS